MIGLYPGSVGGPRAIRGRENTGLATTCSSSDTVPVPFLINHLEAWNIKITLIVGFKPKHYDGVHCQDVGPTFFAVLMPKMSVEQIIIAVEGRWTTTLTVMFRSKTVGQNEKTPNENTQNSLKIFAASGVEEDRWQDLATKRFCIFSAHGQLKPAAEILNSKLRTYFYKHTRELKQPHCPVHTFKESPMHKVFFRSNATCWTEKWVYLFGGTNHEVPWNQNWIVKHNLLKIEKLIRADWHTNKEAEKLENI